MPVLETARFALPLLAAGQAQKELFHNEALILVDFLLNPVVESIVSDPQSLNPQAGQSWLVGADPEAEWSGYEDHIAGWSANGWIFIKPFDFLEISISASGVTAVYRGSWQIPQVVVDPMGGQVVDIEARNAIDSVLQILRERGFFAAGS